MEESGFEVLGADGDEVFDYSNFLHTAVGEEVPEKSTGEKVMDGLKTVIPSVATAIQQGTAKAAAPLKPGEGMFTAQTGMSTGMMAAIGVGVAAVVGGIWYFVSRK